MATDDITRLLGEMGAGNEDALGALLPLVYDEMRRLARHHLRRERAGHTLTTTALVHEAYLKMVGQEAPWENRAHFFGVASMAMRRILVNYARDRARLKRGGGAVRITLDDAPPLMSEDRAAEILALDDALGRLAAINARAGRVVECRYFAGLTIEETAEALGTSPMTVKRDWRLAKTWLRRELQD